MTKANISNTLDETARRNRPEGTPSAPTDGQPAPRATASFDVALVAFVERLDARRATPSVRNNRLTWPDWSALTEDDKVFFRAHRAALKRYLLARRAKGVPPPAPPSTPEAPPADTSTPAPEAAPAPPPAPEPEPDLYVGARRVTRRDVIEALRMLGDDQVAAFTEGYHCAGGAYAPLDAPVARALDAETEAAVH